MKVLLINPCNVHMIKYQFPDTIDNEGSLLPPLGLLYIASFLRHKNRHAVRVLDMQTERVGLSSLKDMIKEDRPDIVGLSTTTFHLIDVYLIAKAVKEIDPDIHVTLGGPHTAIYPDETMANHDVDSIVIGEGEIAFSELVDSLEDKTSLNGINGLVYRDGDRVVKTDPPKPIDDLDALPFPDRRMISYRRHYTSLSSDHPSTSIITNRGCPHRCAFCYNTHLGKTVRSRSAGNVISEIEECLSLGIKDIFFCDDTFILDHQRTVDICDGIIRRGLKFRWGIKTRVDNINIKILAELKKAGCDRIHFGVESGSSRILDILNKGISVTQIKEAFRSSKKMGIETLAFFMLGTPTERAEDILETIDFAVQLEPDYALFGITLPFPDTDLYRMGLDMNVIRSDFWREFAIYPHIGFIPPFWNENLSEGELDSLLKTAYKRFYFRPGYIFKMLFKLTSASDARRKMKMAAGLFKYAFS